VRTRLVAALLAAAAFAGCAHEKTRAEIEAEDARSGTTGASTRAPSGPVSPSDSTVERGAVPDGESPLRRIAFLDDSARRFPTDPRVPRWLYAAGVEGAQLAFFTPETATDSAFLAALPEAYYLNEIAGTHTYTGWHLTTLGQRFPADSLADDAALVVAQHHGFVAGECEGYFFCYLAASVSPWSRFLREHPASPLVPAALAAVDSALRANFDRLEAGEVEFAAVDTTVRDTTQQGHQVASVEATLTQFESSMSALPAPHRDMALHRFEPIRARWLARRQSP
jgi:hypothetical protein